jgi:hypothetical protein
MQPTVITRHQHNAFPALTHSIPATNVIASTVTLLGKLRLRLL